MPEEKQTLKRMCSSSKLEKRLTQEAAALNQTIQQIQFFQCGVCDVSFNLNSDLISHIETHALVKPFKCGLCKFCYSTCSELVSHIAGHENKQILMPVTDIVGVSGHSSSVDREVVRVRFINDLEVREDTHHISNFEDYLLPNTEADHHSISQDVKIYGDFCTGEIENQHTLHTIDIKEKEKLLDTEEIIREELATKHQSQTFCQGLTTAKGSNLMTVPSENSNSIYCEQLKEEKVCSGRPINDRKRSVKLCDNTNSVRAKRKSKIKTDKQLEQILKEGKIDCDKWECIQCHKILRSKKILRSHYKSVHVGDRPWACSDCPLTFKRKGTLHDHMKKVHESGDRPYICSSPGCRTRFKTSSCLSKHVRQQHVNLCLEHGSENCAACQCAKPFGCPHCPAHFRTKTYRSDHVKKVHQNMRGFLCQHCKFRFTLKHMLESHMKLYHSHLTEMSVTSQNVDSVGSKQNPDNDPIPDKGAQTKEKLSESGKNAIAGLKLTSGSFPISESSASILCPDCPAVFSSEQDYNKHIRADHVSSMQKHNKIFCEICGQCFAYHSIKQHMLVHQDQRPFHCSLCHFACRNRRALKDHMRVHTGETPFTCEYCGKSFSRINSLTYHRNTHMDVNPIQCGICSKGFNSYQALRIHKLRHAGDKRYSCEECGKNFYTLHFLKRHALTHKDVRSFVCVHCSNSYKSYSSLMYHLKTTHDGAKNIVNSPATLARS